jgi:hypothetical protein
VTPAAQRPSHLARVAALPRPADGCDRCLTAAGPPPVVPYQVHPWPGGESLVAYYRCGRGHFWLTWWAVGALGLRALGGAT